MSFPGTFCISIAGLKTDIVVPYPDWYGSYSASLSDESATATGDNLGTIVEISSDGTVMATAADAGEYVRIYQRADRSSAWGAYQQINLLNQALAGEDIALSGDGNTLAIGNGSDSSDRGIVYIWRRASPGAAFTQDTDVTPAVRVASEQFGFNVALSDDGSTLIAGAPQGLSQKGHAYVFEHNGTSWATETEITGIGTSQDRWGQGVAISGDGSTIALAGPNYSSNLGRVRVLGRTGPTSWSQETTINGQVASSFFGRVMDFNYAGNRLIIGNRSSSANRANVFRKTGGTWNSGQSISLSTSTYGAFPNTGYMSVSINADGKYLVVGAPGADPEDDGNDRGFIAVLKENDAATTYNYVFVDNAPLTNTGNYGGSVSFSGDGFSIAIGESDSNYGSGRVWVIDLDA